MTEGALEQFGMSLLPFGSSWIAWMTRLAGAGLVLTGSLKSELQTLLLARRKVRKHPLFFIDHIKKIDKKIGN